MNNPFLSEYKTPFQTVPFDQIKNEHYLEALDVGIKQLQNEIELIKSNKQAPTFENTIEPYAMSGNLLGKVSGVFFNLHSANTNDEMTEIAKIFAPKLTAATNDIRLDEVLFKKIKSVFDNKSSLTLTAEQNTLLEKSYKDFVRNGALLDETKKNQLREIDNQLSTLGLKFSDNVLKETNDYILVIDNKDDLKGLPESVIEASAMAATEKGHDGKWVVTLDYPSFGPFLTYCDKRSLREEISKANALKACKGNERDNKEIVKSIANLRHERANLLGYGTHADFVLEERMALKASTVFGLLTDLKDKAMPAAKLHIEEIKEFAKNMDGITDLMPWDYSYYFEKLKKEKYSIDDEMLRPYFKLENVIDGIFEVANKLFGLKFNIRNDIPKYHQDVVTYEVTDQNNNHVAVFYGDYFPRASKRSGAWMTLFREQHLSNGKDLRPHVANVCNFTKPTKTKPSLLSFDEVTTLFHEFGHALHGMLSKCQYETLAGTNVFWDFVELPSQIMENWAYEKECLDLFAKHYETGELIPAELVEKVKVSANFGEGQMTLRQISFGLLDMSWHSADPSGISNVVEHEEKATSQVRLLPKIEGAISSTSFGHIFSGGYSAGYYSYKWAEVLDADAFEFFKEKGIFNKEVADLFRENILEKGGSEHPMKLYKQFRGHEPKVDALLRRSGLL